MHKYAFLLGALLLLGAALYYRYEPQPAVDLTCQEDADCTYLGGSCSAGCGWLMNTDSVPNAKRWLKKQNDRDCHLTCVELGPVACQNNICTFTDN